MGKLLKADLYRIFKSKLFLIAALLALVFPVLTVLLYFGLDKLIAATSELQSMMNMNMTGLNMTGQQLLSEQFVLSSNMGLILPIFITLFVAGDISNGTLRNKIIAGRSRTAIYFSHLITSGLTGAVLMVVSNLIFLAAVIPVFGYGVDIDKAEVIKLVYFYATGGITIFFGASVSTMVTLSIKNTAPAVIISAVVLMGLSFIGSGIHAVDPLDENRLLCLIPTYTNTSFLAKGTFDLTSFLLGVASYAVCILVLTLAGLIVFKKSDIK